MLEFHILESTLRIDNPFVFVLKKDYKIFFLGRVNNPKTAEQSVLNSKHSFAS